MNWGDCLYMYPGFLLYSVLSYQSAWGRILFVWCVYYQDHFHNIDVCLVFRLFYVLESGLCYMNLAVVLWPDPSHVPRFQNSNVWQHKCFKNVTKITFYYHKYSCYRYRNKTSVPHSLKKNVINGLCQIDFLNFY